ncbi:hypothetical protein PI95_032255 [Hassallia byssoidea VB512170]|uniref:Uncharacterized protein n=1 Tax=Hassallia byssoidea VB512170 TaxID=1304833 RepID=A0A846HHP4_9CYAN|nr:hypothetical protein [Hassalia byssoidea]NEU77047.1 hypothetical protein [Hassalia byssoidea VB512170]
MPLFNDNAPLIIPPHPGFVSGKYYASSIHASVSVLSYSTAYVYYTYFYVPYQQNFTRVAIYSNSTFSSPENMRFGVYEVVSGMPSTLVADLGSISFINPGAKEIICSITLTAGWYAIAIAFNPSSITLSSPTLYLNYMLGASGVLTNFSGYRAPFVYGSFPSTAVLTNITETNSPLVWLKAS